MNYFSYQHGILHVDEVPLTEIAKQFGTPCYVYSRKAILDRWNAFDKAFGEFPHRICYAVKANSNLAILNCLAKIHSGFDIVSQGELERVLAAKGDPQKIVFSGVGKSKTEILRALDVGVFCFDVESEAELERLAQLAKEKNKHTQIALRINPNIDAGTHPYIATGLNENKFGIDIQEALPLFKKLKHFSHIKLIGIACHIGSQLTELEPFIESMDCLLELIDQLAKEGIAISHLNLGGGLGVSYQAESPPMIHQYVATIIEKLAQRKLEVIIEPGRSIIAEAGILLTQVEYLKHHQRRNFAIVDAAMNDLIRPALYQAWQDIVPVKEKNDLPETLYDVVGPVCESADFLGKKRSLAIAPGDLLAVLTAGAYGFSMSSNYNSRPRVAEVLVDGKQIHLIRERESITDLYTREKLIET